MRATLQPVGKVLFVLAMANWLTAETVEELFEKRVRPVLVARCQSCHGGKQPRAGLDLTSAAGLARGADSGPVVDVKNPEESALLKAVGYLERIKMPPTGKLAEAEIAALREWVRAGAPWAGATATVAPASKPPGGYSRAQREFWSFRPLKRTAPPAVGNEAWVRTPVDRFILAKLEQHGLSPAREADKLTLLRRATLDLTGLPPTEGEIAAFLSDTAPDAYERVIERLLASPRYGEKWGRHWLDVARYADSTGADEDHRYVHSWRYRDYVIESFNRDVPYHQFIREQIAGDLLPPPAGEAVNRRGIIATGFLALGPKLIAEQDKVKMLYDAIDEEIEVTGKAILGLTLACARCHDHKFDPISTKDYYALASIFASTRQFEKIEGTVSKLLFVPLADRETAAAWESHQKRMEAKQQEIDQVVGEQARRYRDRLAPRMADYMVAARAVYAGKQAVEEVVAATGLNRMVLERWVEYLRPSRERRAHLEAWQEAAPERWREVAREYQEKFMATVRSREQAQAEWRKRADAAKSEGKQPPPAPVFFAGDDRFFTEVTSGKGPLALPDKEREPVFAEDARRRYARLQAELKSMKENPPAEPPFACGVVEGEVVEQAVFHRGNPEAKGEIVPKRFPLVLAGEEQPAIRQGSGRRELAEWLASESNALAQRVIVNRIWQWHFGEGLVRTPSNFGITGERPTHPELLEWLAGEFLRRGQSIKSMHRLLMLSSSYRMASETTAVKREKDADNRLLSRFPMRRLTVEEMRDSLLAIDGSLDTEMGGTMLMGQGTDKEFSDERKSLDPDQSRRRLVYLPLRRSNLPTLLNLFDFGDATTHNESRTQTNVAPQALFMMNSRFVAERARGLVKLLAREGGDEREKVRRAWLRVVGRPPAASQVEEALAYLERFPAEGDKQREQAWVSYCRALIASNDFLYVH
jgi:cytochrome c553